jgi:hypothetical protein
VSYWGIASSQHPQDSRGLWIAHEGAHQVRGEVKFGKRAFKFCAFGRIFAAAIEQQNDQNRSSELLPMVSNSFWTETHFFFTSSLDSEPSAPIDGHEEIFAVNF